jgi:three-Cys-motif partner protein
MSHGSEYRIAKDGMPARVSGEWARDKLYYVERYMQVFSKAMERKWKRRVYFDLMAGPGLCMLEYGPIEFPGSPLLAAGITTPFTRIVAVESDPALVTALRRRLAGRPSVEVLEGDCNDERVIELVREDAALPETLSLAFLDMLGTEVEFRTIERLTADCRMDLVITFQVNDLFRNIEQAKGGPQQSRFDAFFGTAAWIDVVTEEQHQNHTGKEIADAVTEFYGERLKSIGYACVAPLHRLMKSSTAAPLYRLLLASRHARGEELFRKIAKIEARGQRNLF